MIANAWAQTFAQDYAQTEKLLTQLQRVAADATSPESLRKTLMVLEPVLLIYTGRLAEAMERAQRAWNELDRDSAFEKGGLSNVLAYGCIAAGRHDDAQRYLREATACHTVVVPKAQTTTSLALVNSQATAARNYCIANGTAPPGFFLIGDGPVLGPKQ